MRWRLVEAWLRATGPFKRTWCRLRGGHHMRPWLRLGAIAVEFRVCERCPHVEQRRAPDYTSQDLLAARRLVEDAKGGGVRRIRRDP